VAATTATFPLFSSLSPPRQATDGWQGPLPATAQSPAQAGFTKNRKKEGLSALARTGAKSPGLHAANAAQSPPRRAHNNAPKRCHEKRPHPSNTGSASFEPTVRTWFRGVVPRGTLLCLTWHDRHQPHGSNCLPITPPAPTSGPSTLIMWVPRLRLAQPWSSAGIHGCKLRSRGTHRFNCDRLLARPGRTG
jgi:hypothetical protein